MVEITAVLVQMYSSSLIRRRCPTECQGGFAPRTMAPALAARCGCLGTTNQSCLRMHGYSIQPHGLTSASGKGQPRSLNQTISVAATAHLHAKENSLIAANQCITSTVPRVSAQPKRRN